MLSKIIGLLSLLVRNWHIIVSGCMSILGFIGSILDNINIYFAIIVAVWIGLISILICLLIILSGGFIRHYFHCWQIRKLEKESSNRVAEYKETKLAEHNLKAENEIQDIALKMASNELDANTGSRMLNVMATIHGKSLLVDKVAESLKIKGQENKANIFTLFEKFNPYRVKVNELLFGKILNRMKENKKVSLQLISVLSDITDDDLEIIKRQFKYVVNGGICFFTDIFAYLENDSCFDKNAYELKLYNKFWSHANYYNASTGLKAVVKLKKGIYGEMVLKNGTFIHFYLTNGDYYDLHLPFLARLNSIGYELYDILQDEIESTPKDYVIEFCEQAKKKTTTRNISKDIAIDYKIVGG